MSILNPLTSTSGTAAPLNVRNETVVAKTARIAQSVALASLALVVGIVTTFMLLPVDAVLAISLGCVICAIGFAIAITPMIVEHPTVYDCHRVHYSSHPIYHRDVVWFDPPRTIVTPSPFWGSTFPVYKPRPIPMHANTVHPGQGHVHVAPRYQPEPVRTYIPPANQRPTVHPGQGHVHVAPRYQPEPVRTYIPPANQIPTVHPGQGHVRVAPRN